MGDHYLPQHYLKGFAVNDRLWVHDLEMRKSRPGQPKSEANVNGLWPSELERHLAEQIEGPAQDIIDRIRHRQPVAYSEKKVLATYLLTMWKRVPAGKERVAKNIPIVAKGTRARLHARFDLAATFTPELRAEAEAAKQLTDEILDRYIAHPPDHFWHHSVREESTPRMMGALLDMTWTFLVSDSDLFLTCDDPLFFFTRTGISGPAAELSIPLSSTITLLAHRQGEQRKQFREVRASTVVQLNRRTACNARRFMYSESATPWALKLGRHKPDPVRIRIRVA
ncbi:DUF4238 domain-containing protein [Stenotrophomonas terrae]|uniref:DUF4238 domain-containing protein n=1 Tax=Stenotrophomonas terrae TaxID=405446 RepID=UPI003209905A